MVLPQSLCSIKRAWSIAEASLLELRLTVHAPTALVGGMSDRYISGTCNDWAVACVLQ